MSELNALVEQWQKWDKNETTLKAVNDLIAKGDTDALKSILVQRMEFGTAGLRARMGPGFSQMNDLTIIQTTQGFLKYCENQLPNLSSAGIVVGYDGRHNSERWSRLIANIFAARGHRVHWFSKVCPTPFVPFSIRHFGAACGVVVTASHNPKDDNGYKVYWSNGAQIVPPHDTGIAKSITENLEPWETSWRTEMDSPLIQDILQKVLQLYYEKQTCLRHCYESNQLSPVVFTYTAMHGVGWPYAERMFHHMGFKHVIAVPEQRDPDPEFPTVRFPNPEEGKSALNLAMRTADQHNSRIIIANDPDADRLAVAEKQSDGSWRIFNGNETGTLIGWWLLHNHQGDMQQVSMLSSTVSSKILEKMARKHGFFFEETLTGFKWMGNIAEKHLLQGKTVLFAFEEAIGFMCGTNVLDKDGIGALAVMAEIVACSYQRGETLSQKLQDIYNMYGQCVSNNSYYLCYDSKIIEHMFLRLRHWSGSSAEEQSWLVYPSTCGPYRITHVRDLFSPGYDDHYDDKKPRLPTSTSGQMITFDFENGAVVTIRTSGTEPKIKYYSEMFAKAGDTRTKEELQRELDDLISHVVTHFYQPTENGLIARSD